MTAPGNVSAEKLAVDYLTKVTTVALRYLPKGDRIKFVGRTRALIERRCGPLSLADPGRVAAVLAELGEPADLVKRERARIDAARAKLRAAAQGGGVVSPWEQRPVTSRWRPGTGDRLRSRFPRRSGDGSPVSPRAGRRRWPRPDSGAGPAPVPEPGESETSARPGPAGGQPGGGQPGGGQPGGGQPGGGQPGGGQPAGAALRDVAAGPVPAALDVPGLAGTTPAAGPGSAAEGEPAAGREPAAGGEPAAGAEPAALPGLPPAEAGPTASGPATLPGLPVLGPGREPREVAVPGEPADSGRGPASAQVVAGKVEPGSASGAQPGRGPARRGSAGRTAPVRRGTLPSAAAAPLNWASLAALAKAQRREAVAVILLGIGGLLFPLPFWFLGAAVAALSRFWRARYKWLALFGPLLAALILTLPIAAIAGGHGNPVAVYLHILRLDSRYLIRAGCFLTAGYLAWLVRRGPRPRVPPWRR